MSEQTELMSRRWFAPARGSGWLDALVIAGLAGGFLALLLGTVHDLGYSRDEGFYFYAADNYGQWFSLLFDDPARAMKQATVDRYWKVNNEHPAFIKSLFAFSHSALHDNFSVFEFEGTSYRFPGMVLSSSAVAVTYLWGAQSISRFAGIIAATLLACMPRVFYHAHLDCFDMPVVALWLITAYCYWRCGRDDKLAWALVTGVLYGVMLNTKHNSWLFPPVIIAHLIITRGRRLRLDAKYGRVAPIAAVACMLTIGPALFYATWPWLWSDTLQRFLAYARFHTGHVYYNMEFLGFTYWKPPMPLGYAPVMTLATVPLVTLCACLFGTVHALDRAYRPRLSRWWYRVKHRQSSRAVFVLPRSRRGRFEDSTRALWLLSIGCSFGPWILPTTPIFGGTKHWMTAYPFMALFAALATQRVVEQLVRVAASAPRRVPVGMLAAVTMAATLTGPAVMTLDSHPWGLSAYTPIVGGAPGAASLGLNRTFWGYTTGALQPWLRDHAQRRDKVYVHDTALQSWNMMASEGRFGEKLRGTLNIADSDFAIYHHEPHMGRVEYQIWTVYGTTTPEVIGSHHGVPVVWGYQADED